MGVMFALGKPDEEALRIYREFVRPGDTVFDIGANRGQMSLAFAKLVGPEGLVVAFEPAPDVAKDLERNCELNGLANVNVICAAAASEDGEQVFSFPTDRQTQGKLSSVEPSYDNQASQSFRVRTVTLDSVARELGRSPQFIKIDVEGAGGVVLSGGDEIFRQARPSLYFELHGPEEQAAAAVLVRKYGYRLTTLDGEAVSDPTAAWKSPLVGRPGQ
jgi:FkbM family methyltransferase